MFLYHHKHQHNAHHFSHDHGSHGFSLIEVLIASSLSLFIILGVISLYTSNKNSYQLQEAISHLQRNSNFAAMRLSRTIRAAGYSGFYASFSTGVENTINTPTNDQWNISQPLKGFDNAMVSQSYAGITNLIAGTDAILLKRMVDMSHPKAPSTKLSMTLDAADGYHAGDILIATNQQQASIFQISAANHTAVAGETTLTLFSGTSPQPGNSALMTNSYDINAEVGKLESTMYYLKTGENGRAALFEAQLQTSATTAPTMMEREMVADIENMQITYGIDSDNNGIVDRFDNATTVESNNQWALVRTVGISLLIASDRDNITATKNSYSFNATRFTFLKDNTASAQADKRLRRSFTTYISIRNS